MARMNGLFEFIAALFQMDERVWERHANPWSVWTRFASFPLLMLAIWSWHWIGWACLIPILLLAAWLWLNPRIFPPPASTHSWASRAVLGERVFLLRFMQPVPVEHTNAATLLGVGTTLSGFLMLAGFLAAEPFTFVASGIGVIVFKLWFCDRMVWLFDEMSEDVPEYRAWRR
jgi:hypothetical protein